MNETKKSVGPPDLIPPFGGRLVQLVVEEAARVEWKAAAVGLPSIQISDRALCDLELLACGAFSPLDRFMGRADYERVLGEMRLDSGCLFPIPVTLPVSTDQVRLDREVALRDSKNNLIATLRIEEAWEWDLEREAGALLGSTDSRHPLIAEMHRWGASYVSGALHVLQLPAHYDFPDLRLTPVECRRRLEAFHRPNVVAFPTARPLYRVDEEVSRQAIASVDGVLLLHSPVGRTLPGAVEDYYTRVRTYRAVAAHYFEPDQLLLALLPLAGRLAGPREALWHAIIHRNYGANHLVVGRHDADPEGESGGRPFFAADAAQELVEQHREETGVQPIPLTPLVYLPREGRFEAPERVPAGRETLVISDTEVRDLYLSQGKPLPEWHTRPAVAEILAERHPPRHQQGVCIWFTGLSGSGKSTTAEVLAPMLLEYGRRLTLLDGDVVRTHLSKGLSFSKEDRDTNIRRIGYVASEICRHGGTVICAVISPYRAVRNQIRNLVGSANFVEVFIDTPVEVCETRDVKGMYAKARRGEIQDFTGVDDPYEPPEAPELILNTVRSTPEENARAIIDYLIEQRFIFEVE